MSLQFSAFHLYRTRLSKVIHNLVVILCSFSSHTFTKMYNTPSIRRNALGHDISPILRFGKQLTLATCIGKNARPLEMYVVFTQCLWRTKCIVIAIRMKNNNSNSGYFRGKFTARLKKKFSREREGGGEEREKEKWRNLERQNGKGWIFVVRVTFTDCRRRQFSSNEWVYISSRIYGFYSLSLAKSEHESHVNGVDETGF